MRVCVHVCVTNVTTDLIVHVAKGHQGHRVDAIRADAELVVATRDLQVWPARKQCVSATHTIGLVQRLQRCTCVNAHGLESSHTLTWITMMRARTHARTHTHTWNTMMHTDDSTSMT